MYVEYKVEVWIKAEIDSGTTLTSVIENIDKIPSKDVNFVETEEYLSKTEKFILPLKDATLKVFLSNGKEMYANKI